MVETTIPKRKISARKAPNQERSKARVDQILEVTCELMATNGLEKLTTNHIAKASGMAVGSLYRYFPNKQAIIYEIYLRWLGQVRERMERFLEEITGAQPIIEVMQALAERIYGESLMPGDDKQLEMELRKAMSLYPELREEDRKHGEQIATLLSRILERAGLNASDKERMEIGAYLYGLDSVRQDLMEQGMDQQTIRVWQWRATFGILQPFLPEGSRL
jgi:AcrR family transcriptional regulator